MAKYVINPEHPGKMQCHKFEIEIEYVHNLKELYKRLQFYLEDEGWLDLWGDVNYEIRYWQKNHPGDREEHQIWWRAWKTPSTPYTKNEFFKYFFTIDYQTINSQRKEIMHQGKKWKLWNTNTILRVTGYLIVDYEDSFGNGRSWNDNWFLKTIRGRWHEWMYKEEIERQTAEMESETVKLQNVIKDFLAIRKDTELAPNVYPENMLPQ
ncbi:MAG: hypothetical protein ACMXYD_03830 [Candidatus Woesearchaeota archaeon]